MKPLISAIIFTVCLLGCCIHPLTMARLNQPSVGSDVVWHRTFGGALGDYGNDLIQCRDGGYLIVGGTLSTGVTHSDCVLVRTDWDGNQLWNRSIGGLNDDVGYRIIECANGGFAITGYSRSNPSGRSDAWLVRTAADGTPLWNQTYGGLDNDQGFALIEVSTGGFAIVGSTQSYGSENPITHLRTYDVWLIRTDALGNMLWNRSYGETGDDIGRSIHELNEGGFILLGEINSSFATLDHSGEYTEYHPDAWLLRISTAGNLIWNQTYGGDSNDFIRSLAIENDGGFTIVGFSNSYGTETYDGWVIKTDNVGSEESIATFGSLADDYFRTILQCDTTGYALIGYSYVSASADLWISRTNNEGYPLWTRIFGGPQDDVIRSGIRSQGDFILVGYTFSFGAGARDVWLVKISDEAPPSNPLLIIFPAIMVGGLIVLVMTVVSLVYVLNKRRRDGAVN